MVNIKFRADGSTEIGLGHLVRSKALADMLKGQFGIEFFCKFIPLTLLDEFNQSGLRVNVIESEQEYFNTLGSADLAVIDGYGFDIDYQKKLKEAGSLLICIDDLAEGEFVADLIINQSPGIQKSDFNALSETKFALGPDYALLRSSFFSVDAEFSDSNLRKNLLICFGGSDVQNFTEKALVVATDFKEFDKITIIAGSAYRHEDSLMNVMKHCGICEYHHSIGEQKMAELMIESDVAIVPASGILFEALVTKNVVISGMYIENQIRNYTAFKKQNAFIDAGRFTDREIKSALNQIKSFSAVNVVDGKSPERLISIFKELVQKKPN